MSTPLGLRTNAPCNLTGPRPFSRIARTGTILNDDLTFVQPFRDAGDSEGSQSLNAMSVGIQFFQHGRRCLPPLQTCIAAKGFESVLSCRRKSISHSEEAEIMPHHACSIRLRDWYSRQSCCSSGGPCQSNCPGLRLCPVQDRKGSTRGPWR